MAALIDNSAKIAAKDNVATLSTGSFAIGGSNRVLYVCPYSGAGTPVVATEVKWGGSGGTALTKVGTEITIGSGGNGILSVWRLINPSATTSTVYVNWGTNQDERLIIAVSVKDANQVTPNGTIASAIQTSLTPNLSAAAVVGDLVINFLAIMADGSESKTLTASQTTLQEIEGTEGGTLDGYELEGAEYTTAASTSQNMGWTVGGVGSAGTNWAGLFSFAVNAAAGGGGGIKIPVIDRQFRQRRS